MQGLNQTSITTSQTTKKLNISAPVSLRNLESIGKNWIQKND